MADWSSSMSQTFEYYTVDPKSWKDIKKIDCVVSSTISRDKSYETLGSASFEVTEPLGECYVRIYLVTNQNGVNERFPLGTFLLQTPSVSYDGMVKTVSIDAYTPLLELKENLPPLGYSLLKGEDVMGTAYRLMRERMRAPVIETICDTKLFSNFVANLDDTWLSYISDLIAYAKYSFDIDEMGRILFVPEQTTASLQPVWDYNDDNSSILLPDVTITNDIYNIPNVVEVIYSSGAETLYYTAKNEDINSPVSIQSRGREIVKRVSDPSFPAKPTQAQVEEYAKALLKSVSTLEYTVSYTHGYCPVRVGDCVRLNYNTAGLKNIKARVISQSIDCSLGCSITETAVFTTNLWG